MSKNQVISLFEGYSHVNDEIVMKANCSVTLVKTKNGKNILVR